MLIISVNLSIQCMEVTQLRHIIFHVCLVIYPKIRTSDILVIYPKRSSLCLLVARRRRYAGPDSSGSYIVLQSVVRTTNGQYNLTYFVWTGSSFLPASSLVNNMQLLGYQRMAIQLQYPVTVLAVGSLSCLICSYGYECTM